MTYRPSRLLWALFLSVALAQSAVRAEVPKDEEDELFYSLGVMFAQTLGEFRLSDEELTLVMKGVKESASSVRRISLMATGAHRPRFRVAPRSFSKLICCQSANNPPGQEPRLCPSPNPARR